MTRLSVAAVVMALDIVQKGVDWSAKWHGVCPLCGKKKCKVYRTMEWEGSTLTRYHKCKCGHTFKSLQVEVGE